MTAREASEDTGTQPDFRQRMAQLHTPQAKAALLLKQMKPVLESPYYNYPEFKSFTSALQRIADAPLSEKPAPVSRAVIEGLERRANSLMSVSGSTSEGQVPEQNELPVGYSMSGLLAEVSLNGLAVPSKSFPSQQLDEKRGTRSA